MWSAALAAGIPNELFWELTMFEVLAVLERQGERDKAENRRAGLVAATIVNVNRKKGAKMVQPGDFFRSVVPRSEDYISVEAAKQVLDGWAKTTQQEADGPV